MMNVLNVTANMARPCTDSKECICVACTRKKRLEMLGFSESAVKEFLESNEEK